MQNILSRLSKIRFILLLAIVAILPSVFGYTLTPIVDNFQDHFFNARVVMFPFITGKNILFRVLVEIGLALWVIDFFRKKAYGIKNISQILPLFAFVLLLSTLFISNMFGVNAFASFFSNYERMEGWIGLLHVFGFLFLCLMTCVSKEQYQSVFKWSLIGSLSPLYAAYGQHAFASYYAKHNISGVPIDMRIQSSLGNAAYVSLYAVFCITFALLLLEHAKKWYSKLIYIFFIIAHGMLLYFSTTRGTWLGFLGSIFVYSFILFFRKKWPHVQLLSRRFFLFFIGTALSTIALLVFTFLSVRSIPAIQNNALLGRFAAINTEEATSRSRLIIWDVAFNGFKDRPLLGWGQENFEYVFAKHYDARLYNNEQWFDRAHNVILDWLISGGIVGLFLYLSIFVTTLVYALKLHKISPHEQGVLIGVLIAYTINNLFIFDNITSYIFISIIIAYIIYLYKGNTILEERFESLPKKQFRLFVVILTLSFASLTYSLNYAPFLKNITVARMSLSQYVSHMSESEIRHNNGIILSPTLFGNKEAIELYYDVIKIILSRKDISENLKKDLLNDVGSHVEYMMAVDSYNPRHPYILGNFFFQIGAFEQAKQMYTKALELTPNKQSFIFPLIDTEVELHNLKEARLLAERAYDINAENPKAPLKLAVMYGLEADELKSKDKKAYNELLVRAKNKYPWMKLTK